MLPTKKEQKHYLTIIFTVGTEGPHSQYSIQEIPKFLPNFRLQITY